MMEKYGVLTERECSGCGYHIVCDDKGNVIEIIKKAAVGLFGIEHVHDWEDIFDGREESGDLRPEQHSGQG